jgi:uncharacterized protein
LRRACLAAPFAILLALGIVNAGPVERHVVANGFPATLTLPNDGHEGPTILFIAGSGPTDRNGNNPLGTNGSYLAKLAHELAARGIASLRYDKRGIIGSQPAGREEDITLAIFAEDAAIVLDWLRAQPGIGPVLVAGHSEGGFVGLDLAARRTDIAGIVLIATPGRPPADIVREQLAALSEPFRSNALRIIDEIEAGREVDDVPDALLALFRPSVQPFLRSLFASRPAERLAGLAMPAMIIGGGSDLQVGRADFDALRQARPDADTLWLEKTNHVLVDAPLQREENLATYAMPDLPLSDGLAAAIAGFASRLTR